MSGRCQGLMGFYMPAVFLRLEYTKKGPNAEDGAAVAVESHHSRPRIEFAQWLSLGFPADGLQLSCHFQTHDSNIGVDSWCSAIIIIPREKTGSMTPALSRGHCSTASPNRNLVAAL